MVVFVVLLSEGGNDSKTSFIVHPTEKRDQAVSGFIDAAAAR